MVKGITFDQIRGPIERALLVALGWLAAKGWISPAEVAGYATLVIGIIAAVYGWWQNRPQAVIQSAAAVPGTTVVTTSAIAAATPETNIVSNANVELVHK